MRTLKIECIYLLLRVRCSNTVLYSRRTSSEFEMTACLNFLRLTVTLGWASISSKHSKNDMMTSSKPERLAINNSILIKLFSANVTCHAEVKPDRDEHQQVPTRNAVALSTHATRVYCTGKDPQQNVTQIIFHWKRA